MGLVSTSLSDPEPQIIAPSGKESDWEILGPGETRHAVPWDSLTSEQKQFQAMKQAIHAAMIDRLDRELGRVLDQLRAMIAMENALRPHVALTTLVATPGVNAISPELHPRPADTFGSNTAGTGTTTSSLTGRPSASQRSHPPSRTLTRTCP